MASQDRVWLVLYLKEFGTSSSKFERNPHLFAKISQMSWKLRFLWECTGGFITGVCSTSVVEVVDFHWVNTDEMIRLGKDREILGRFRTYLRHKGIVEPFQIPVGLSPGDPVWRTHKPFTIELGPGLLGNCFDIFQRRLDKLDTRSFSKQFSLDSSQLWHFKPERNVGEVIGEGCIFGTVLENDWMVHKIMIPANESQGKIVWIAPEGIYTNEDTLITLESEVKKTSYSMVHKWPLFKSRCFKQVVKCEDSMRIGMRIFDLLCPVTIVRVL